MKLEYIETMPVECPTLREEPPGERFVFDWVADPSECLAEIFEQCIKDPKDLCEIGRVAFGVYAQIDKERQDYESEDA